MFEMFVKISNKIKYYTDEMCKCKLEQHKINMKQKCVDLL